MTSFVDFLSRVKNMSVPLAMEKKVSQEHELNQLVVWGRFR
jgi:hypothetical protein